jgi:hypothetical protein
MAVTAESSGTQTAVITTEHEVASVNEAGVFTFHIDLNAMVAGDILEVRVYQIVLTGGVARVVYYDAFYGAQPADDKVAVSMPVSNELTDDDSIRFTIKQTHGTGRNYPWKVLKHG